MCGSRSKIELLGLSITIVVLYYYIRLLAVVKKKMSFSSRLLRMRTGSSSNSLQSRLCSYCCHHDVCYLSLTKVRIEVQGGRYEFYIGVACSMYNYIFFSGTSGYIRDLGA